MGMDVYGKAPTSETGVYFRSNVWWWHPLWEYCESEHPKLVANCPNGHVNEGGGLEAKEAVELGKALLRDLATGRVDEWEEQRKKALSQPQPCLCVRNDETPEAEIARTYAKANACSLCNGTGQMMPQSELYPFGAEMVQKFADFLVESGGFEIW